MSRSIRIYFLSIFSFFLFSCGAYASSDITVESKEIDERVYIIFHHNRSTKLRLTFNTNLGTMVSSHHADVKLLSDDIYKYTSTFSLNNDHLGCSFYTKEKYLLENVIYGEQFTALKLKPAIEKANNGNLATKNNITQVNNGELNIHNPIKNISEIDESQKKEIKVLKKKGAVTLSLPVNKDVKFAIWKRGNNLWVALNGRYKFYIDNKTILNDFEQMQHQGNTLIKFADNFGKKNIHSSISNDSLNITLSTKASNILLSPKNIEGEHIIYKEFFSQSDVISMRDPIIGDDIKLFLTNDKRSILIDSFTLPEYSVMNSFHGIAIATNSDNTHVANTKKDISISVQKQNTEAGQQNKERDIHIQMDKKSMLPIINDNLLNKNFISLKEHLWQDISKTQGHERYNKILDLAQFYFMHGLYHESLAIINLAKEIDESHLQKNTAILLQKAVTFSTLGRYADAKEIYDALISQYANSIPEELEVWNNYNNYNLNTTPSSIGFASAIGRFISSYPEDLYWKLTFAELDLCLKNNNLRTLESLFKTIRSSNNPLIANSVKLYKSIYYQKRGQLDLAKQSLLELSKQYDRYNSTRAELELIRSLKASGEITVDDAIRRLESLKFKWRGDKTEFDILLNLAELYKENKDAINALRTYKYIISAFDQRFQYFYITSQMVMLYNEIFKNAGIADKMNDFDAVALFYEFHDLTPIGKDGDDVILKISQRFVNLDLLEKAAQLLEHQVTYRLSGEQKVVNADHLALIYLMMHTPDKALSILYDTDNASLTFEGYQYRGYLKAKALIDMQKYNDALRYLTDDQDGVTRFLKREVYFYDKKWHDYIKYAEDRVFKIISNEKLEKYDIQDIVRLAIAYSMVNQQANIRALRVKLKANDDLIKIIDSLVTNNANSIDYNNIDKSLDVDPLQRFVNEFKKLH